MNEWRSDRTLNFSNRPYRIYDPEPIRERNVLDKTRLNAKSRQNSVLYRISTVRPIFPGREVNEVLLSQTKQFGAHPVGFEHDPSGFRSIRRTKKLEAEHQTFG